MTQGRKSAGIALISPSLMMCQANEELKIWSASLLWPPWVGVSTTGNTWSCFPTRKGNSVSGRKQAWTCANRTKETCMQPTAQMALLPAASA